ncbi:MAG: acetyl-CoA decarbonylase/synthase complex subunit gamma [Dehalococcoidales bacterium]|nr:acetyl-CoA decarbonylase/synthase complex subunit gamma [Dehalococcoidales bacterium]
MALTGIQIFKLLPKSNCGKCGVPTCLAFAMNLAAGKAELTACPTVSEEAKAMLAEASAPPIRPVTIGTGEKAFKVGGETVLFRHEKRFENPTGIAILVSDDMTEAEVDSRVAKFNLYTYERVGLKLRANAIAIKKMGGDIAKFTALVNKVAAATDGALILMASQPEALAAALKGIAARKPLLYAATKANAEAVAALAKEFNCPVAVKGASLEEVAELTALLEKAGVKDMVIDSGARTVKQLLADQVHIRASALVKKFRPLGYPTITLPCEMTSNPMKEALIASMLVSKYAGIIVLSDIQGEVLFPLLVERMNIFTDPQRPLATTPGIYEINNPNENSPILITTNFSLTYFIVSGEIEGSKVPSYLLIMDTEGLSVMTAWAAGKFVADLMAQFVKKSAIEGKVKHRKLIIPGYSASESGGLEEDLSGWEILVGPREASHLPAYLKSWKA